MKKSRLSVLVDSMRNSDIIVEETIILSRLWAMEYCTQPNLNVKEGEQ